MMTGEQYKTSLNDGRATYFEGHKVDDLPAHPILGQCVDVVAENYDRAYSPAAAATNPLMAVPRSSEELRAMIPELHKAGMMAHVTHTSIAQIGVLLPQSGDLR